MSEDEDEGLGTKLETLTSYILAVFFVVLVLGMAALTVQMIVNGV